jgi:hypothetical protein
MPFTFTLSQKAKKTGGDKFVCKEIENFLIYFPQEISRKNNECFDKVNVCFDGKHNKDYNYTFNIDKKAKKTGGDKFVCKEIENFSIYFPQEISRNHIDECFNILYIDIKA